MFRVEVLGGPDDGKVVTLERFATHMHAQVPTKVEYIKRSTQPTSPATKVVALPIRAHANGKAYAMWYERKEV